MRSIVMVDDRCGQQTGFQDDLAIYRERCFILPTRMSGRTLVRKSALSDSRSSSECSYRGAAEESVRCLGN